MARSSRARAADLKAIAQIRDLQSRAAESEAILSGNVRRDREERHARSVALAEDMLRGWAGAVEQPVFDPALARAWHEAAAGRHQDERDAAADLKAADEDLGRKRAAWHAALARKDVAAKEARKASRDEGRCCDEARLGTAEDYATARARRK